jgi:hypothetical protein
MPSSRPHAIPTTVHVVRQLEPASILDVGVGFGKWGLLFREYTDIRASEADSDRYRREAWKVRIDGVEGFPQYLTPVHEYVYDRIHVGLVQDLVEQLDEYDVVHVGDMIEHLPKAEGMRVLEKLLARTRKALIASTPKYDTHQADSVANELERHRSVWTKADFQRLPGANVVTVDKTLLLAVIVKPGVPVPRIRPALSGLPEGALGLWLKLPELLRRGLDRFARRPA